MSMEAEGYFELGMLREAWLSLEELPPEIRSEPEALAMRVRIYLALGKMEDARTVAVGLTRQHRHSAESWISLARVEAMEGRLEAAKRALKKAMRFENSFRMSILDDVEFESLL